MKGLTSRIQLCRKAWGPAGRRRASNPTSAALSRSASPLIAAEAASEHVRLQARPQGARFCVEQDPEKRWDLAGLHAL